jgi:hypothetical protein
MIRIDSAGFGGYCLAYVTCARLKPAITCIYRQPLASVPDGAATPSKIDTGWLMPSTPTGLRFLL